MGFPNMPGNQNFVQGQVSASTPGTPGGGATQQLQSSQAMTHTGKVTLTQYLPCVRLAIIEGNCNFYKTFV